MTKKIDKPLGGSYDPTTDGPELREKITKKLFNGKNADRIVGAILIITGIILIILGVGDLIDFELQSGKALAKFVNASPGVLVIIVGVFIYTYDKVSIGGKR